MNFYLGGFWTGAGLVIVWKVMDWLNRITAAVEKIAAAAPQP